MQGTVETFWKWANELRKKKLQKDEAEHKA